MRVHARGCNCGLCNLDDETKEKSIQEIEEKQKKNIEDHGWYCHAIGGGDDQTPTGVNYHTHGCLESFGHPDLQIVAPMPPVLAHNLFGLAIEKIKAGEKFKAGDRLSDIIKNMDVALIEAQESGRTVLRMVLPDTRGELDREKMDKPFNTQWDGPPSLPGADLFRLCLN